MRKSALGRGLGQLMEPRGGTTPTGGAVKPESSASSTGVRIFLSAGATDAAPYPPAAEEIKSESSPAPAKPIATSVLVSLVVADVLLCVLAWEFVRRAHGSLGWVGWALIAAAVALGGWLSLLAVQLAHNRQD